MWLQRYETKLSFASLENKQNTNFKLDLGFYY